MKPGQLTVSQSCAKRALCGGAPCVLLKDESCWQQTPLTISNEFRKQTTNVICRIHLHLFINKIQSTFTTKKRCRYQNMWSELLAFKIQAIVDMGSFTSGTQQQGNKKPLPRDSE
jgi:hypothetical protein